LWALALATTNGAAAGSERNRALDDQAPPLVSGDGLGSFFVTLFWARLRDIRPAWRARRSLQTVIARPREARDIRLIVCRWWILGALELINADLVGLRRGVSAGV